MTIGRALAYPLIVLVRGYQRFISPMTPPSCRYYPSCSSYAVTALQRFGLVKGGYLATRRLLRCHPWAPGGVDHVPETTSTAPVAVPGAASASTVTAFALCVTMEAATPHSATLATSVPSPSATP